MKEVMITIYITASVCLHQASRSKMQTYQALVPFLSIILSFALVLPVQSAIKCREGEENDCSKCYSLLVENVTDDDRNQFNLQYTFFPPNDSSPAFVIVFYHYDDGSGSNENETKVWFWSTSTFYLFHPLHVYQFTSLFFSDLDLKTKTLHLNLHPDCYNASEDNMRLLTQRLKIYTTRQSIASPIDEHYDPKVESVDTISKWHDNNKSEVNTIFSAFICFPLFSWLLLTIVVLYINDCGPNPRMKKIKNTLEGNDENKKRELKYQLQNECILSICFVIYAFIMSSLALHYRDKLDEEVEKYYHFSIVSVLYSLSFLPFIQDLLLLILIIIIFAVTVGITIIIYIKKQKGSSQGNGQEQADGSSRRDGYGALPGSNDGNKIKGCLLSLRKFCYSEEHLCLWRFCAYSGVFSLACVLNHLNYIIIGFIHNLYHATGIAVVYGVVLIFLMVMLDKLPYLFGKRLCQGKYEFVMYFILKIVLVLLLAVYMTHDILIYYFLPINNVFDVAGNNFISTYNTVFVLLTVLVAYFLIKKRFQSPITIFTEAQEKIINEKEAEGKLFPKIDWKDMTDKEKDVETARNLWLKVFPDLPTISDSDRCPTEDYTTITLAINSQFHTEDDNLEMEMSKVYFDPRYQDLITIAVKLKNKIDHKLILFDFSILGSNKLKVPLQFLPKENKTLQFPVSIQELKGYILYVVVKPDKVENGVKLDFLMKNIKSSNFIFPVSCTEEDFSTLFQSSSLQHTKTIQFQQTADFTSALSAIITTLHMYDVKPQEDNPQRVSASLYGRSITKKNHVCLKIKLENMKPLTLKIDAKGSDSVLISSLLKEIEEIANPQE